MAKKEKSCSIFKYLKETKISIMTGTLMLFTQSIVILNLIPSLEVQGQSVLRTNVEALLSMI